MEAVIHDYDEQPVDIADEVARNGAPRHLLQPPIPVRDVALRPLMTLPQAHRDEMSGSGTPVFRRLSANRLEAWMPKEGWLFDSRGKLLVDAHVPRRDGGGGEWFGAFLPDGRWITTDLWENDRQLTCLDVQSAPRWELAGSKIVDAIRASNPVRSGGDVPAPSIGWARADRTGHEWLVSVGTDWTRGFALVTPSRHIQALPNGVKLWREVYPRSMDVRGMFTHLYIDDDDATRVLSRDEAGHGPDVGWPTYDLSGRGPKLHVVIREGNDIFGFWPHAKDVHIGTGAPWDSPSRTWFFEEQGRYRGEIVGSFLADAANERDILTQTGDGVVDTVHHEHNGSLTVVAARQFSWPDGTPAIPLALYDELKLGFFLQGNGIVGNSDNNRRARAAAVIVLARW